MDAADTLARLNYVNGLRLGASDLRAEQQFHIEVRQRLTQALFTPGIAAGLEVDTVAGKVHYIRISPGVAIDHRGRAIILAEAVEVPVFGVPNPIEGVVLGNYVAIEYGEERVAPEPLSSCTPAGSGIGPLRSAPSRIRHAPRLMFLDAWPGDQSGRIVLAQVSLGQDCQVKAISADVRRYVTTSRPPTTIPVSLEGEKDIDAANPKVLRFHIEGDTPQRAVLYLQAARFSSLYYTELGRHAHALNLDTKPRTLQLGHTHTADDAATDEAGEHTHNYRVDGGERDGGIDVNDDQVLDRVNTDASALLPAGAHTHTVSNLQIGPALGNMDHTHLVQGDTGQTGATAGNARTGAALGHLNDVRMYYDGQDITAQVIAELNNGFGPAWVTLGDGSAGHRLVTDGTGPVDLIRLGLDLGVGAHRFEFRIGAGGGGQIQYNLYLS